MLLQYSNHTLAMYRFGLCCFLPHTRSLPRYVQQYARRAISICFSSLFFFVFHYIDVTLFLIIQTHIPYQFWISFSTFYFFGNACAIICLATFHLNWKNISEIKWKKVHLFKYCIYFSLLFLLKSIGACSSSSFCLASALFTKFLRAVYVYYF